MNNYIELDGHKYKTQAKSWKPQVIKPGNFRVTLLGAGEGTFGVVNILRWEGMVVGPVSPETAQSGLPYGDINDLLTSLKKRQNLTFRDHYGTQYTVTVLGPFDEIAFHNMWDALTNRFYIPVQVMAVEA